MRTATRSPSAASSIDDAVDLVLRSHDRRLPVPAEATEQIVLAALELADSVALRYRGRGVEIEDLRQVARLALVKAARRYRPAEGGFTAFAVPTIRGEVKRYFRDHGWVVRPPRSLQEGRQAVSSAQESLRHHLGRDATTTEVATLLGLDETTVRETQLCSSGFRPASLDAPLTPDGGCLGDALTGVEDPFTSVELRAVLEDALRLLDDRERLVLRLRFGEEMSQAAIGARIGVSQMQVSRILASITRRLRLHLDTSVAA